MKNPSTQKQNLKSTDKRSLRAKTQAKALRENLRRRKTPKPAEEKDN